MKDERIYIRTTEKMKCKLLKKSQEYNMSLSDFMLTVTERECDLDIIQRWIYAYVDFTIKRNRLDNGCVITHYYIEDIECWSVPPLKNTYESRIDLLEDLQDVTKYELPKPWVILDNWTEFVRRLTLLGMWEELKELK